MARPRTHDESLRTRLLEEASHVIASSGPQGLSLRGVAGSAQTTTAAVYSLFGGRNALIQAVVEEGFRRFGDALADVSHTADPGADLLALGVAYREFALADPHFYRIMFDALDETFDRPATPVSPTFLVLRAAVARALGVPDDRGSAEQAALRIWALAHGLVSLELNGLIPGDDAARHRDYVETLRSARGMVSG
ncbi:TetR/AcrR family transcriptional regulator [Nesterenkonia xinjiangensis]|uniref:AcrR family transcriptional regulator n=1 Tax=Nesterenkonia xinjiangensis TaxID=225327 RepID=A0A7Z0KBK3_9MICC|nr:TetR/AcrR family transcriptional regulator [Nesterenkonia xinjiangensis]NYJ77692.1 AcrR family transcriptional regulator [Nesterenkonia xinjiangensis]